MATAAVTNWSVTEMIQEGWQLYKDNWKLYLKIFATIFALGIVDSFFQESFAESAPVIAILVSLVLNVVSILLTIGFINIILKLVRGQKTDYNELFEYKDRFWRYLLGSISMGIVVMLGFVLLIVPGIYAMLRFMFVPYLIADKKMSVTEAFEASTAMTEGEKMHLLGFGLALTLLNILGLIALFVGVYFTAAASTFASALVYNRMLKKADL